MMESKILVLGATGKTGKRVAQKLQKSGLPIREGSRNGDPSFDWEKPENWSNILSNVQMTYITFQPDLAVPGAVNKIQTFVEVARQSGVQKLVLLSGRGEKEAQACENIVIDSGLSWTIVRASWFMQNFSEHFFLDAVLAGHLVVPKTVALEPFVDVDDIAEVVVETLVNDEHNENIYELTGPELLSFKDTTQMIGSAIDRPITYQEVSMDEYVNMLREYRVPEDTIWLIKYLFTEVLDGRNESLTDGVGKVLGREPTSFKEYIAKTKSTGAWEI